MTYWYELPPAMEGRSLNHWTAREIPRVGIFKHYAISLLTELSVKIIFYPPTIHPYSETAILLCHNCPANIQLGPY